MSIIARYPELRHLLDTMVGAQKALRTLIDTATETNDVSLIRIALSEAETVSKAAVKLSLGISALEAEMAVGNVSAAVPTADPEEVFKLLREFHPDIGVGEGSDLDCALLDVKVEEARERGVQDVWSTFDRLRVKEALGTISDAEAVDLAALRRSDR